VSTGARRAVALAVLGTTLLTGTAGCGKDAFPDRSAQVTIGGRVTVFHIDSCGLDHRTAFVVGRAKDGSILQAVIGVRADHRTGIPASTGITVTADPASVSAFGEESWHRRGESGTPPGRITSARIRGSRIQVGADAQPVDAHDQPTQDPLEVLHMDARCDQRDDKPPSA
jgi:hypothetical protein